MTICQKKLREVMESLCRTERILDEAEAGTQLRQPLLGTPEEPPRLSPPLRDRSGKPPETRARITARAKAPRAGATLGPKHAGGPKTQEQNQTTSFCTQACPSGGGSTPSPSRDKGALLETKGESPPVSQPRGNPGVFERHKPPGFISAQQPMPRALSLK
ncbi:hypothetical protein JRQ81_008102 [Phrynocephalus forsythii]|uniref:Uncharacterized protein n=1 Tax=Phrynocephalus forsythii TaxID=171643 RepID=A0A9Q0XBF1_9SAUR|nr:hypothetical protein JRQ81_008102 [Phrynocephalus forsythii]